MSTITKQGSLLAHAAIPAAVHVGQNLALKANMASPAVHANLANNIYQHNLDKISPTLVQRGVIPEMGFLGDETISKGQKFIDYIREAGINPGTLTKTEDSIAHDLMTGKYTRVFNHPEAKEHLDFIKGVMGHVLGDGELRKDFPQLDNIISSLNSVTNNMTPLKRGLILRDLEKIHGSYALTDKLMAGVGTRVLDKFRNPRTAITQASRYLNNRASTLSDVLGTTAVAALDPIAGAVNVGKKIITDPKIYNRTPLLRRISDGMENLMVNNPVKAMYQKGLAGKDILFRPIRKAFDNIALNPITSDLKNIAYDAGKLINRWR